MEISNISHIAICVRDLDRSLAFYHDLLGMQVIFDEVQDTTTGGLPHVYKRARAKRRTVHLRFGSSESVVRLVLTDHRGDDPDGEAIKLDQVGISHLSFTVPDVNALTEELVQKGVKTCGPADAFRNAEGRVRTVFFYDPDGILVQFDDGSAV